MQITQLKMRKVVTHDFSRKWHTLEEQFSSTLRQATRDVVGKLLQSGSRVIFDSNAPESVMEDTPKNRAKFKRLIFSLTG